jgi:hypothetical protein
MHFGRSSNLPISNLRFAHGSTLLLVPLPVPVAATALPFLLIPTFFARRIRSFASRQAHHGHKLSDNRGRRHHRQAASPSFLPSLFQTIPLTLFSTRSSSSLLDWVKPFLPRLLQITRNQPMSDLTPAIRPYLLPPLGPPQPPTVPRPIRFLSVPHPPSAPTPIIVVAPLSPPAASRRK